MLFLIQMARNRYAGGYRFCRSQFCDEKSELTSVTDQVSSTI
jgi:hypothetical protein